MARGKYSSTERMVTRLIKLLGRINNRHAYNFPASNWVGVLSITKQLGLLARLGFVGSVRVKAEQFASRDQQMMSFPTWQIKSPESQTSTPTNSANPTRAEAGSAGKVANFSTSITSYSGCGAR